jgi:hypothetical protein
LRNEVIAAKERVMRALDAVGPELSQVLVDICCELKGLEKAERSHDWPQRAGKVVLQLGLTRLAGTTGSMSRAICLGDGRVFATGEARTTGRRGSGDQ